MAFAGGGGGVMVSLFVVVYREASGVGLASYVLSSCTFSTGRIDVSFLLCAGYLVSSRVGWIKNVSCPLAGGTVRGNGMILAMMAV